MGTTYVDWDAYLLIEILVNRVVVLATLRILSRYVLEEFNAVHMKTVFTPKFTYKFVALVFVDESHYLFDGFPGIWIALVGLKIKGLPRIYPGFPERWVGVVVEFVDVGYGMVLDD